VVLYVLYCAKKEEGTKGRKKVLTFLPAAALVTLSDTDWKADTRDFARVGSKDSFISALVEVEVMMLCE
jgi:hypothetical protein